MGIVCELSRVEKVGEMEIGVLAWWMMTAEKGKECGGEYIAREREIDENDVVKSEGGF